MEENEGEAINYKSVVLELNNYFKAWKAAVNEQRYFRVTAVFDFKGFNV